MVGVTGAWLETTVGIRAAVASGLEVITNTTLTKDNLEYLSGFDRMRARIWG